jgi:hypothetical protein
MLPFKVRIFIKSAVSGSKFCHGDSMSICINSTQRGILVNRVSAGGRGREMEVSQTVKAASV